MDSRIETYRHIQTVQRLIGRIITNLTRRQQEHDQSKLTSPEVEIFDEYTPKLAGCTYGSELYASFLAGMKPALDHHYAANDHHPEYHSAPDDPKVARLEAAQEHVKAGPYSSTESTDATTCISDDIKFRKSSIRGMNLVQLVEMLCDWKAATMRHKDGDIRRSIEINQGRFGYSDEIKQILLNTLPILEREAQDAPALLRD